MPVYENLHFAHRMGAMVAVLLLLAGLEVPATHPAYCPGAALALVCGAQAIARPRPHCARMHLCDGVNWVMRGDGRRATGLQLRCDTTREARPPGPMTLGWSWGCPALASRRLVDESRRRSVLQPLHSRSRLAHETRHGACGGGRVALQCAGGDDATAARKTGQVAATDAGAGDAGVQEDVLEGAAREIAAARSWLGSQDAAKILKRSPYTVTLSITNNRALTFSESCQDAAGLQKAADKMADLERQLQKMISDASQTPALRERLERVKARASSVEGDLRHLQYSRPISLGRKLKSNEV